MVANAPTCVTTSIAADPKAASVVVRRNLISAHDPKLEARLRQINLSKTGLGQASSGVNPHAGTPGARQELGFEEPAPRLGTGFGRGAMTRDVLDLGDCCAIFDAECFAAHPRCPDDWSP